MYKILVYGRGFSPDPHRPFGDFEIPLGQHAVPSGLRFALRSALRASLRARRAALGDFQNLFGAPGIWAKIPSQKPEFTIQIYLEVLFLFLEL